MPRNTSMKPSRLQVNSSDPESIHVDGSQRAERYLILIDNQQVWLTGNSFRYFMKLAWARCHCPAGWIYSTDIETGDNQTRYLHRMKNEVIKQTSHKWPVIENNRLGYYRLCVSSSAIHFNLPELKKHPDFQVRMVVEDA